MAVVEWFFGRGLSMGCGIDWGVPHHWKALDREHQINLIRQSILREMSDQKVDTTSICRFLEILAGQTELNWQHRFHTTNWDYLLQREISKRLPVGELKPRWLVSSHVYHHNGTVEHSEANQNRSPMLLETDMEDARVASLETDKSFNGYIWSRVFVVVGMSFECSIDRFLINVLGRIKDEVPVGESLWILVNPCNLTLERTRQLISDALPKAKISVCAMYFNEWIDVKFPELQRLGIFLSKTAA